MPIYEYRCQKCHTVFEEWLKHADNSADASCPACREKAERIISNTSFMLKGGGWYATEYGNRKQDSSCAAGKNKGTEGNAPAPACGSACSEGTCPAAAAESAS